MPRIQINLQMQILFSRKISLRVWATILREKDVFVRTLPKITYFKKGCRFLSKAESLRQAKPNCLGRSPKRLYKAPTEKTKPPNDHTKHQNIIQRHEILDKTSKH